MLPHTYGSRYTISHIHTEQAIQSPTYIQIKAYTLLQTYWSKHTFNHKHSPMNARVEACSPPQTFSHKNSPTNMVPQTYWPRHTIAQKRLLPELLVKAHTQLRTSSREHFVALHDPYSHVPVPEETWSSKHIRAPTPQQRHLP